MLYIWFGIGFLTYFALLIYIYIYIYMCVCVCRSSAVYLRYEVKSDSISLLHSREKILSPFCIQISENGLIL